MAPAIAFSQDSTLPHARTNHAPGPPWRAQSGGGHSAPSATGRTGTRATLS